MTWMLSWTTRTECSSNEVDFKSGSMEYSYEINAASGAILKHEAELDD